MYINCISIHFHFLCITISISFAALFDTTMLQKKIDKLTNFSSSYVEILVHVFDIIQRYVSVKNVILKIFFVFVNFRKYLDLAEVYDLEFVFDYKGDYSRLKKIIQVVVTVVQQFRAKKQYPLNVSLEMRFMTSR